MIVLMTTADGEPERVSSPHLPGGELGAGRRKDTNEGSAMDTGALLERAQRGDAQARDELMGRYLHPLRRWAHGRLPVRARGAIDTDDLVQVTMLKALNHLDRFEYRHEGGFLAYLRQILLNEVRQEIRQQAKRPGMNALGYDLPTDGPSPLEQLIGQGILEAYDAALMRLSETQRTAVVLRLECGFTHELIAQAIGSPSANAARMTVKRAILKLAEVMEHDARHT